MHIVGRQHMTGILPVEQLVQIYQLRQLLQELVIAPIGWLAPLHFADGCHTGHIHILQLFLIRDILRPEVGLHADDVLLLVGIELIHRVERINLLHRQETADGLRLTADVLTLVIVQISM